MLRRMPLAKKSNNTGDNQARGATAIILGQIRRKARAGRNFAVPRGAKTERCGPAIQGNLGGQGAFTGESREFRDWHTACVNDR